MYLKWHTRTWHNFLFIMSLWGNVLSSSNLIYYILQLIKLIILYLHGFITQRKLYTYYVSPWGRNIPCSCISCMYIAACVWTGGPSTMTHFIQIIFLGNEFYDFQKNHTIILTSKNVNLFHFHRFFFFFFFFFES